MKIRLSIYKVDASELIFLRRVQEVIFHVFKKMKLFNVVVGMKFLMRNILVTIGCCQTENNIIIVLPVLNY